jgi:integrase
MQRGGMSRGTGRCTSAGRRHTTARVNSCILREILSWRHTGRPLSIRTTWQPAVKRAGLEDFRFHDLRHMAASYLVMNGASLAEIAEILGHRSLEMTRRYAHLNYEHTRKVLASMNEVMFG